jgi:hypothetical protein
MALGPFLSQTGCLVVLLRPKGEVLLARVEDLLLLVVLVGRGQALSVDEEAGFVEAVEPLVHVPPDALQHVDVRFHQVPGPGRSLQQAARDSVGREDPVRRHAQHRRETGGMVVCRAGQQTSGQVGVPYRVVAPFAPSGGCHRCSPTLQVRRAAGCCH